MAREYVEFRDGGYWLSGARVSLDSIVSAYLRGESAESIAESYPAASLEQVYGAIAYYLSDRPKIDEYLRVSASAFEQLREESRKERPGLYAKLQRAREANRRPA